MRTKRYVAHFSFSLDILEWTGQGSSSLSCVIYDLYARNKVFVGYMDLCSSVMFRPSIDIEVPKAITWPVGRGR